MSRTFNEATRVQMPAMVHLCRLGYHFYGKMRQETEGSKYDGKTNILLEVFRKKFEQFNPDKVRDFDQVMSKIQEELDYDDLGKAFYKRLVASSPKLIDFDDPAKNDYHFTAEFTCKNGENEFRPDITLFINGLPLVFVEVKKPNNAGGMLAESRRMNEDRFPNRAFRRFINITQLMIFSNNMEYDNKGGVIPIEGAFYCTGGRKNVPFNCFREQKKAGENTPAYQKYYPYARDEQETIKWILSSYNNEVIVHDPEFEKNLHFYTPTNRILTSMCAPERLLFILKYGIAYVRQEKEEDGKLISRDEKHIMRYQQLFAALDIREALKQGTKSGIVWHTQGSGKTALSYYLTKVLTDFYSAQNTVARFYFIVDRLDLLTQASQEFEARGLMVSTASSKEELAAQFQTNQSMEGNTGQMEITVVNIQKFTPMDYITLPTYATNLQRIFIMDEAHRGYKPGGCFLANLFDADKNAVKLALTGTPLLNEERSSCAVFGQYLSTYYYDRSIADGYTRRIIREEIETSYREKIDEVYEKLDGLISSKKDVHKETIIEHDHYVDELLRYIIHDMTRFRSGYTDLNPGGMVICETSEQARKLYDHFERIQCEHNDKFILKSYLKAGLVLYNSGTKEEIQSIIKDFKKNETIDILFVFNMLLTGFDAPRLKRLYFCRKMDGHNLLQAITRVNRPYGEMRYGYLIDFANIKKNFDETNQAYLTELAKFNDPDAKGVPSLTDTFESVMAGKEEIIETMHSIRNKLFDFALDNAELFSSQISTLEDKQALVDLREALTSARDMGNMVRTFGDDEMRQRFSQIDISKLPQLLSEVQHRINLINAKECFELSADHQIMINEAMAAIEFNFSKIGEEELVMANREQLQRKYEALINNLMNFEDKDDEEFITIREAFMQRFHEYGFEIDTVAKFTEQNKMLDEILQRLRRLQLTNAAMASKYNDDYKFARVHKRIREENARREKLKQDHMIAQADDMMIQTVLKTIKQGLDEVVYDDYHILKQDAFFRQTVQSIIATHTSAIINIGITKADWEFMSPRIYQQYVDQYEQTYPAA